MKKPITVIVFCLSLIMVVMLARVSLFKTRQMSVEAAPDMSMDSQMISQRLSTAVQLRTISYQDSSKIDAAVFMTFHRMLKQMFPITHSLLKRETVNNLSLLYKWKGRHDDLKPVLFLAHMDVVPSPDDTIDDWEHPPFGGTIDGGSVWGRGTIDDKASLIGIFEALEILTAQGYKPDRTIYIALGHDEEVGGQGGASSIAKLLKSRDVKFEWILDEGGVIVSDAITGCNRPIASPGIAEKGYVTLELSVRTAGGHSSMPPTRTAIGILANAVAKLEKNPFPATYNGIPSTMFSYIGPELPFSTRFLFANSWLFNPVIKSKLERAPSTNAMLRTTAAPTVFQAGLTENILPKKANALINFRIHPSDTIDDVLSYVKDIINDEAVLIKLTRTGYHNASPVTATESDPFRNLQKTIHEVFPDAIVAPSLLVAGTDTKHYIDLSENIFRFLPLKVTYEDLRKIHGTNERINIEDYQKMIQFYTQLIRNSS